MERPFPPLMIFVAFLDVGSEEGDVQNNPVQQVSRKVERPDKIDKKDDACLVRPVPGLVLVRVIEEDCAPLLPAADAATQADGDPISRLGYNKPKMKAKDPVVKASVRRQMLARLENGKHRGF
jgi:hypothetical protein